MCPSCWCSQEALKADWFTVCLPHTVHIFNPILQGFCWLLWKPKAFSSQVTTLLLPLLFLLKPEELWKLGKDFPLPLFTRWDKSHFLDLLWILMFSFTTKSKILVLAIHPVIKHSENVYINQENLTNREEWRARDLWFGEKTTKQW